MKNKVKIDQIALLLIIPGGKLLALPAKLAQECGHDSWLVMLIMLAIDAVCITFLLWGLKHNTNNLSLSAILQKTLGKVGEKIVLITMLLLLMSRVVVVTSSCYKLFDVTFSVQTNWVGFVLPILAVAFFAVSKGFQTVARVNELLFGLVLVAFVSLMVMPTVNLDFAELKPVGETGTEKILNTCADSTFWFCDYLFVYFVLADIDYTSKRHQKGNTSRQKPLFAPLLIAFAVGAFLNIATNAIFVSIYGDVAKVTDLAMSKISMFSVSTSTSGRWDWLSVSMWSVSVLMRICIYVYCAYRACEYIFEVNTNKFNFAIASGIFIFTLLPLVLPVETYEDKVLAVLRYPFVLVQYVLPVAMPWLVKTANKKVKNQKRSDAINTATENNFCDAVPKQNGCNGGNATNSVDCNNKNVNVGVVANRQKI